MGALLALPADTGTAAEPAAAATGSAPSYARRPEVRKFIREMVRRHGFVESELVYLFSRARRVDPILQAISAPAEKVRSWKEYREILVSDKRLAGGLEFWNAHRAALERAQREFGVPAEYIVAIIGVETLYGQNTGRYRVIDALATLAFDYPPRSEFFREELVSYLRKRLAQGAPRAQLAQTASRLSRLDLGALLDERPVRQRRIVR